MSVSFKTIYSHVYQRTAFLHIIDIPINLSVIVCVHT